MVPSLFEVLFELPDFRQAKGKRHELAKVIIVIIIGLLCCHNSLQQLSAWVQGLPYDLKRQLGNRHHKMPSYGTIRRVLLGLDASAVAGALQNWTEMVVATLPDRPELVGLAIDGKTLRGSAQPEQAEPALQVLNAALHPLGLVLQSQAIASTTNEIGALPDLLAELCLSGRVVTGDALHTQRKPSQVILEKGGIICFG